MCIPSFVWEKNQCKDVFHLLDLHSDIFLAPAGSVYIPPSSNTSYNNPVE